MVRKIIQIATTFVEDGKEPDHVTTALCDDGTVWERNWPRYNCDGLWYQLPPIPQDTDA
jgi:hypothetical protein